MITTYHRPETLEETLRLLTQPNTFPLGGGSLLSQPTAASIAVVDLQLLGLNVMTLKGNEIELGATCTLQKLLELEKCPEALKNAVRFEAPLNLRNSATLAGSIVASNGRSTLLTMLLSMDAKINFYTLSSELQSMGISEYIIMRPPGLIVSIVIPNNIKSAFESISKTPADTPIVCAALSRWNSGRTRLALGGYGKSPILAMDGTETEGAKEASQNAYYEANDEWASAEYRIEMAALLATRCLDSI